MKLIESHQTLTTYLSGRQCVFVSHSITADFLRDHRLQLARLLCAWNSPGKNTEVGCHSLFLGIFPTWAGIESGSPALQADSLPCKPPRKPQADITELILKRDKKLIELGYLFKVTYKTQDLVQSSSFHYTLLKACFLDLYFGVLYQIQLFQWIK